MSSTGFSVGIAGDEKISSRVLKPPGGGHTDIFAPPEEQVRAPRPKNNQQNSTMMGEIMGKSHGAAPAPVSAATNGAKESVHFENGPAAPKNESVQRPAPVENTNTRGRVPPGGFSQGLW